MYKFPKALFMIALALTLFVSSQPQEASAAEVSLKLEITIKANTPHAQSVEQIVASKLRGATNKSAAQLAKMAEQIARAELKKRGVAVAKGKTSTRVALSGNGAKFVAPQKRAKLQTASVNTGLQQIKADMNKNSQAADSEVTATISIQVKF